MDGPIAERTSITIHPPPGGTVRVDVDSITVSQYITVIVPGTLADMSLDDLVVEVQQVLRRAGIDD